MGSPHPQPREDRTLRPSPIYATVRSTTAAHTRASASLARLGLRPPLARESTPRRIHRPQSLISPHSRPPESMRHPPTPQRHDATTLGPLQSLRARVTYRACAQCHTSTSSAVCSACRRSRGSAARRQREQVMDFLSSPERELGVGGGGWGCAQCHRDCTVDRSSRTAMHDGAVHTTSQPCGFCSQGRWWWGWHISTGSRDDGDGTTGSLQQDLARGASVLDVMTRSLLCWLRVGFLRQLHQACLAVLRLHHLDRGALHLARVPTVALLLQAAVDTRQQLPSHGSTCLHVHQLFPISTIQTHTHPHFSAVRTFSFSQLSRSPAPQLLRNSFLVPLGGQGQTRPPKQPPWPKIK